MAEKAKSFVLYIDLHKIVSKLSDEDAGIFIKAILALVNNETVEELNPSIQGIFEFVKMQIERDQEKYRKVVEKRRAAGKKSAEKRLRQQMEIDLLKGKVEKIEQIKTSVSGVNDCQQVLAFDDKKETGDANISQHVLTNGDKLNKCQPMSGDNENENDNENDNVYISYKYDNIEGETDKEPGFSTSSTYADNPCFSDLFMTWLHEYGNTNNTLAAWEIWKKLPPEKYSEIMQHTRKFTALYEIKFRPSCDKYLREKRYLDDLSQFNKENVKQNKNIMPDDLAREYGVI